jgi:hypothetical protein
LATPQLLVSLLVGIHQFEAESSAAASADNACCWGGIVHIVTLNCDDGFIRSANQIADIYERRGLSACFDVIATGHQSDFLPPDSFPAGYPKGDFKLWNALQRRTLINTQTKQNCR